MTVIPRLSDAHKAFVCKHKSALTVGLSFLLTLLFVALVFVVFIVPRAQSPFADTSPYAALEATQGFLVGYYLAIAVPLLIAIPLVCWLIFFKKAKLHTVFLVAAILCGIPQSFVNTPNSWYDEETHYYNSVYYADLLSPGNPSPRVENNNLTWQRRAVDSREGTTIHDAGVNEFYYLSQHLFELNAQPDTYTAQSVPRMQYPYQYAPQIVGVSIAHFFDLGQVPTYYLGRLFSFAFFVACLYLIIKRAPFKTLFCLLGLVPLILGTAGSFSYDTFITSAIFVFTAYVLHLAFVKEKVGKRDVAILLISFALFAPLKMIYFPLLFLILLIPRQKWRRPRTRTLALVGAACAGAFVMLVDAAGLIALASNMGNATSFNEQRNLETYNYGIMLEHPFLFIKLMGMSILDNITGPLQGTRYLLILGADMPLWTAIFIGVVLLKGTSTDLAENNHPVSLMQKRVIACVCAVIYLLSIVAFIPYTETGAATVQGLQGRYYLPLFP
ncbi:MAG: DUF2142 domain-containing protein, partial [Coriobacteriales bacterium]|nr:DUF2142 domain-containing protein [Coriobacteriales bacterium]